MEGKEKKEELAGKEETPSEHTNSLPCLSRIPRYDWFVRDRHRSESRGDEWTLVRWVPGDWSEKTDLAIMHLAAVLRAGSFSEQLLADIITRYKFEVGQWRWCHPGGHAISRRSWIRIDENTGNIGKHEGIQWWSHHVQQSVSMGVSLTVEHLDPKSGTQSRKPMCSAHDCAFGGKTAGMRPSCYISMTRRN